MVRVIICSFLTLFFTGCASMTSMVMNRDDNDNFSRNSILPQKGVPVTVRVPTHLKVRIEEEYYITSTGKHLYPEKPILSVQTGLDYEDKIFMVDLKRPGVGTIQTDIQIDPETQYFQAIKGKVVDNTIKEIGQIIGQLPKAPKGGAAASVEVNGNPLNKDMRTVAYARFDINAVDFEQQLNAFFDQHINNCNDCSKCN